MRILFYILFFSFSLLKVQAQSASYSKNLEAAVQLFDKSQTKHDYELVFQKMEGLYKQNTNQWLPAYYASIIKTRMAMKKMGDTDDLADEAIQWLHITKALHNSDEVLCLESLAYTSKMSVSPTFRWKAYESRIKKPLEQAIALNKNNPRAYLLQGNLQYKMPVLFGGGCAAAKPMIQKAKLFLDAQKEEFTTMPHWGRPLIVELVKACPID